MRITNSIMINNNLSNINKNKLQMDNIMTQIDTTKKIQRPSEDPISAIRALRLRTTLNEIQQYKDRNVTDADAWMGTTADALSGISGTLEGIIEYCNQGVNEYQTVDEYTAIVASLKQYQEAIYQSGNADYGDRTIFTGYKTDSTLTFTANDATTSYEITEDFEFSDIETLYRAVGVKNDDIENITGNYVTGDIKNNMLHMTRLSYKNIDKGAITIEPNTAGFRIIERSIETFTQNGDSVYEDTPARPIDDDAIYYIPETGELIFGDDVYNALVDQEFSITYTKTGFDAGDLKPEHYFDCVKTEVVGNTTKTTEYTEKDQPIDYAVSFNQTITVNVQAKDVLTHQMGRDLDEIIERVEDVATAIDKKNRIQAKMAETTDEDELATLQAMLDAAEIERAYAQENLENSFSSGIAKFKDHQQVIIVETSDLAARMKRLSMIEERLDQQSLTVEELKSKNEDTDLAVAAVEYNAISDVYDAALSTAAKVVQKSLLDFI